MSVHCLLGTLHVAAGRRELTAHPVARTPIFQMVFQVPSLDGDAAIILVRAVHYQLLKYFPQDEGGGGAELVG